MPVLAAAAVSQRWFRPGAFIAQGDVTPFVRTGLGHELGWLWNHELTGAGSPSFQIVRAFEVLLIRWVSLFGGGELAAQRVLYAGLFGAVAFAGCFFARRFTDRPVAVATAGLVACINPFVMTQLPNPFPLAALAAMGVLGGLVLKGATGEPVRPVVVGLVTVASAYLFNNIALFTVTVAWVLALVALASALVGPGGSRRAAALLLRCAPWSLALNLWWLVPVALSFAGGSPVDVAVDTDVRAWSWTHVRSSVSNVLTLNATWAWTNPDYFPYGPRLDRPYWGWLRFLLPAAAFAAPVLSGDRPRRGVTPLVALALALVFLGKGLHPPLADVNLWLYDHVAGLWLLREPFSKLGAPLVLVYCALAAVACAELADRLAVLEPELRRLGGLAAGAVLGAVLAYPYPLWTGEVIPGERPSLPSAHVRIPGAWRALAAQLNSVPATGKALVLPLADYYQMPTTWGYYGSDVVPEALLERPVIQPAPATYFNEQAAFVETVRGVEASLLAGDLDAVPPMLRSLGASHVVLRRDLDRSAPGRTFADPDVLGTALDRAPGVRPGGRYGVADLFEVTDPGSALIRVSPASAAGTAGAGSHPGLRWRALSPARYSVVVDGAQPGSTVVLAESYAPGWSIRGLPRGATARHFVSDGYANGWHLDAGGDLRLTIEYGPALLARAALRASQVAGMAALLFTALAAGRRRRAGPDRPAPVWATAAAEEDVR